MSSLKFRKLEPDGANGEHQVFDKAADLSTTNDSQESVVDGFIEGDGKLFLHKTPLQKVHVFYTYSISSREDVKQSTENSS